MKGASFFFFSSRFLVAFYIRARGYRVRVRVKWRPFDNVMKYKYSGKSSTPFLDTNYLELVWAIFFNLVQGRRKHALRGA